MAKSLTPGIALGSLPNACGPGQPCAAGGSLHAFLPSPRACPPVAPPRAGGQRGEEPAPGPAARTPRRAFGGRRGRGRGGPGSPVHVSAAGAAAWPPASRRAQPPPPRPGLQPLPGQPRCRPGGLRQPPAPGSLQSPPLRGTGKPVSGTDRIWPEVRRFALKNMYVHVLHRQGKHFKHFETWQRRNPSIT